MGDNKAREGLEPSVIVIVEKVVSEEVVGWVDGLRFGFGSLANEDGNNDDNKPKAAPLIFVACVKADINALSATVDPSELLASNDNNEEEELPVLSLPSPGGLTST